MTSDHIDVDGMQWTCTAYTYLENTSDGHSKFYRAARVHGPLGNWEFVQWGRIGQDTLTAQRQVWPDEGKLSSKIYEKENKGYKATVDTEVPRLAWVVIVASIKAQVAGPLAPDWIFAPVPDGGPRK